MLVICSFSDNQMIFKAPDGFNLADGSLVLGNYKNDNLIGNGCVLQPWETRVYLF